MASVHVRLFNKQTNTNQLPAERFTNCSPNVWLVCSLRRDGPSIILVKYYILI
ncbi:hypothetical protein Hanom_Chr01g00007601 [Helianthus anomalus]